MLLDEACSEYGWSSEVALATPSRRFFAMLDAARKRKIAARLDDCGLAAVAVGGKQQYEAMYKVFFERLPKSEAESKPTKILKGKEALDAMRRAKQGR